MSVGAGAEQGAYESEEKALRLANEIRGAGADIIYASGLVPEKWAALSRQHFPCCGHVGYRARPPPPPASSCRDHDHA